MSSDTGLVLWPADLPLPYESTQGEPQHITLASGTQQMRIQRRNRFRAFTVSLSVRWVLSIAQHDSFKSFYRVELDNGVSQFVLPLRYPYNSELTEWKVRFIGNYTFVYEEGVWIIGAELELLESVPQEEPIPVIPLEWEGFHTREDEGWVQFVEAGGNEFYVKKS